MGRIDVAFLQFAQGGQQGVLAFARLVEEFVGFAHHFAQHLAVLFEDGDQRAVVDAGRALHRGAHLLRDVIDDVGAGFGSFHGGGFGSFVLLEEVALDEHVAAQQRGDDESGDAAVDQYEPHRQGDQEAADGRDEPPGHDGHDARDAIHGAFASPGLVCERRSHRYHEADVGGRKRQFERRGHRNKHGGGREVHRGADHVVGGAAVLDVFVLEAAADLVPDSFGDRAVDRVACIQGGPYDGAREERRAVLRLALALRRKRNFGFGDVHRLFRGPERDDHDDACRHQHQEIGRNAGVQPFHQNRAVAGMTGDAVCVESGYRDADEVHQVVACECQSQGEGAREDRKSQNVDFQPLQEEEQQAADGPAQKEGEQDMLVDPFDRGASGERGFESFEDGEVEDRREGGSAPEGTETAEHRRIAEREDQTGDIHD